MSERTQQMSNNEAVLKRRMLLGFGVGSLGPGIYSITPSVLLLYFMTDTLGVSAALAALAVALPKFWDVFSDPIMGVISDRTRSPWGRRRPYLLAGAFLMSVSFVFLFSVPESLSPRASFIYVLVVYVLSATVYTVYAVPYISMPAEMSKDPHQRTVIMSYRMFFAMAGLVLGSSLTPQLVDWFGGGRAGYSAMSFIVGGFCAATMLVAFFATKNAPAAPTPAAHAPLRDQVSACLKNKPFLTLISVYFLQLAGVGVFTAIAPYFFVYALGASASLAGGFFLFFFGVTTLSMPVWVAACKALGKRGAYALSILGYSGASLAFLAVDQATPVWMIMALASVMGLPFGGIMMIPFSMLTDTIHFGGESREGMFTGLWTAGEKSGLAFGPLIAGLLLTLTGFVESVGGAAQSASAITGVRIGFAAVPPLFAVASLLLLRRYSLSEPAGTAAQGAASDTHDTVQLTEPGT